MTSRMNKVNQQLKKEIGQIIQRELSDGRFQFVSIISVETSKDLRHARVYYSFFGDPSQSAGIDKALHKASGLIRRYVGGRMKMRNTPELKFVFDSSIKQGAKIDETLRELENEEGYRDITQE